MALTREQLNQIYTAELGRAPQAEGIDYWLGGGTNLTSAENIRKAVSQSPEAAAFRARQAVDTIPIESSVNTTTQQDMTGSASGLTGGEKALYDLAVQRGSQNVTSASVPKETRDKVNQALAQRPADMSKGFVPSPRSQTDGGVSTATKRPGGGVFNAQVADDLNRGIRSLERQLGSLSSRYDRLSSNYQDLLAQFQELQSRRMAQPAVQTDTGPGTAISGGMGAGMQPSEQTTFTPYTQLPAASSLGQQMDFLRPSMLGTGAGSLQDPFSTDPFNVDPFTLNPYPGASPMSFYQNPGQGQ